MTGLVVILAAVVLLALGGLMCMVVAVVVEERRQRRHALQRALIVQVAEARMRAVSRQAVLAIIREGFGQRGRSQ